MVESSKIIRNLRWKKKQTYRSFVLSRSYRILFRLDYFDKSADCNSATEVKSDPISALFYINKQEYK
jgi:hypothetical protein